MTVSIDLTQSQLASIAAQSAPPVVVPPVVVPPVVANLPTIDKKIVTRPKALIMCIQTTDGEGHTIYPGASDGNRYQRKQTANEVSGAVLRIGGRTEAVKLQESTGKIGSLGVGMQRRPELNADGTPKLALGTTQPAYEWYLPTPTATFDATIRFQDPAGVWRDGPTKTFTHGVSLLLFDVPGDLVPEGWHDSEVVGLPSDWGVFNYGIYNRRGGLAGPHAFMPVCTSSHHHALDPKALWRHAWVPAVFNPTTVPLTPRAYPDVKPGDQLVIEMIAPVKPEDMLRTNRLPSGIMSTANSENYYLSTGIDAVEPAWAILDGPRGRGNIAGPLAGRFSQRADSPKIYIVESWRFLVCDVASGGVVKTLAGWVYDEPPAYTVANERYTQHYTMRQKPRLVGDWSRVARKGFHSPWGLCWWSRSLELDVTAPLIGGEPPHKKDGDIIGPRAFIPDTLNNRLLELNFSATDRLAPVIVTEFATDVLEPWDNDSVGDVLYVTCRKGNELRAYDIPTRRLLWSKPMASPSGLRVVNGELYVGRMPGPNVGTIDKATVSSDPTTINFLQHCVVPMDNNSSYVNISVAADDSFYPAGTAAAVTWSNRNLGKPWVFDPAGVLIDPFKNAIGAYTSTGQYATCVDIAHGRMLFGSMLEGLNVASRALSTDRPMSALAKQGQTEYADAGYPLTHGDGGFGYYLGNDLPWSTRPGPHVKSLAIDAYMAHFGHKP